MQNLTRFWRSLETVGSLSGVSAMWRRLLGDEYDLAARLLRPQGDLALEYPHPDPYEQPYRVITHGPERHVGINGETGQVINLTSADVTVLRLDRPALHRNIAAALGLDYDEAPVEGLWRTCRLGRYCPAAGHRFPAYLTIQYRVDALLKTVDRLAATHDEPFLLLAPTHKLLRPAGEDLLRRKKSPFIALCDALVLDENGAFRATRAAQSALAAFREAVAPAKELRQRENVFRQQGNMWTVGFAGKSVHLRDMNGLMCIAHLLANPDKNVHCRELLRVLGGPEEAVVRGTAGEVLDQRAIDAYKDRVTDLQEELELASRNHDFGRQESLQSELDSLQDQLIGALGLGGRRREKSDAERVRKSLSMAVSRARKCIGQVHPKLGHHLLAFIRTGLYMSYVPDSPTEWAL